MPTEAEREEAQDQQEQDKIAEIRETLNSPGWAHLAEYAAGKVQEAYLKAVDESRDQYDFGYCKGTKDAWMAIAVLKDYYESFEEEDDGLNPLEIND